MSAPSDQGIAPSQSIDLTRYTPCRRSRPVRRLLLQESDWGGMVENQHRIDGFAKGETGGPELELKSLLLDIVERFLDVIGRRVQWLDEIPGRVSRQLLKGPG